MLNHPIKAVFFDLDHTLWDFERNSELTFHKIFEELTIPADVNAFVTAYKPVNIKYWKLYRQGNIQLETMRHARLMESFGMINYAPSEEVIERIKELYISYLSSFTHLMTGAKEVLEYLKPNLKLYILTNGFRDIQQKKLRNTDILHYFTDVIDGDSVGCKNQIRKYSSTRCEDQTHCQRISHDRR